MFTEKQRAALYKALGSFWEGSLETKRLLLNLIDMNPREKRKGDANIICDNAFYIAFGPRNRTGKETNESIKSESDRREAEILDILSEYV